MYGGGGTFRGCGGGVVFRVCGGGAFRACGGVVFRACCGGVLIRLGAEADSREFSLGRVVGTGLLAC